MNKKNLFAIIILILSLLSCKNSKVITYNQYTSPDKTYKVEIPSNALKKRCVADFMSFIDEDSHLIINIQSSNYKNINEYIKNKDFSNNKFTYNLFHSSDTSSFYKLSKGNNMWIAYELHMLKKEEGKNYIISVSSDILGQSELIDIIKYIYSSLIHNKIENTLKKSTLHNIPLKCLYSNKDYTIKYPEGWECTENIDEMTDVYIGSASNNFGFTIVKFETNYSLSQINTEGNKSITQAGFIIKEEKPITLRGLKCYRAIHEVSIQNQNVEHISYTFKRGNMLYNIKFGSVTTKAQETLASEIIETFDFK